MTKRENIFNITKGKCFYCGCDLDFNSFHMDHVFPKSIGGKDKDNLVPTCRDCNMFKGNLRIEEFRDKIGTLLNRRVDGRMISKYYAVEKKPIRFYFEDLINGNL